MQKMKRTIESQKVTDAGETIASQNKIIRDLVAKGLLESKECLEAKTISREAYKACWMRRRELLFWMDI